MLEKRIDYFSCIVTFKVALPHAEIKYISLRFVCIWCYQDLYRCFVMSLVILTKQMDRLMHGTSVRALLSQFVCSVFNFANVVDM